MEGERIQKVLARAGHGSRRQVEALIEAGRITVDGAVPEPGTRLAGTERVCLDGRPLRLAGSATGQVIAYHKPVGVVCTRRDPEGRPDCFSDLPRIRNGRWIAVGRLDINTCGLLLFTDDGALAHRLMHPSAEIHRHYAVRVLGTPSATDLERLTRGVELDDGPARFLSVSAPRGEGANVWLDVTLGEGRKREVRRLFEAVGLKVNRLIRTQFGPVRLHRSLQPGATRLLTDTERASLYKAAGMDAPPSGESAGKPRPGRGRPGHAKPARSRTGKANRKTRPKRAPNKRRR